MIMTFVQITCTNFIGVPLHKKLYNNQEYNSGRVFLLQR